ncbi:MFS transporter [Rhizosaccharibacter radicis]|uniref:MFS transporter n=1 Tax=Rhizosaccharibacter radicis TaxID=2782605 RepID=A0ABT1VWK1_9PROT|nr:MFS transporter [Acetobacteraceae bacterium KSS12]
MGTPRTAIRTWMRWNVMFLVFLIVTVSYLDRTNLSVAAPTLMVELKLSPTQLGLIFSAFSWSYALAQIPAGIVATRLQPRRTYLYGMWSWCLLLVLSTTAGSFGAWILFRIPFGLAEAITWPAASILLSRWFPRVEFSQAMALQNLGLVVGAAVAPPLVAFILGIWGWRVAFIVTGLVAGALGTVFFLAVRDDPDQDPRVSEAELAWIRHDRPTEEAIKAPRGFNGMLLRRPSLWAVGVANFGLDFINFMFLTWYPTYLSARYHLSLKRLGALAMEPYVLGVVTVLGAGWLVRRLSSGRMGSARARRLVIAGGLLLGTCALFSVPYASNLYLSITAMSLGYAFVMSILGPMWSTPAEVAGRHGAGFVSGFVNFIGNVGGILSPILMGVALQRFASFTPAIVIAGGVTLVCGVLFTMLFHPEQDRTVVENFLQARTASGISLDGVRAQPDVAVARSGT